MRTTGIVRKIDELGRIVLPKELRKNLNIHTGDDFQISVEEEKIILEKYSRLINIESEIINIINIFKKVYNYEILIVYNNKYLGYKENISSCLTEIIQERKIYSSDNLDIEVNNKIINGKTIINPIIIDSDLLGAVIVIGQDDKQNMKLISDVIKNLIKKNL